MRKFNLPQVRLIKKLHKNFIGNIIKSEFAIIFVLLILWLVISYLTPTFASQRNIINVLRRTASTGIVAIGMTFVIGTGGIDLSVGGQVTLLGVIIALGLDSGYPLWVVVTFVFILGIALGLFNGLGVTILKIPPIMVTLSLQLMTGGLALYMTNGRTFSIRYPGYDWVGLGSVGKIPVPILIFLIVIIVGSLLLKKFAIGRKVLAVGSNAKGAWYAGINVIRTTIFTYILTGVTCVISTIILSSKLLSASATTGEGMEMNAIAAIVIGGTSLSGGTASIVGTVAGALMIETIANWMTLQNVNSYLREVVKGFIILLALLIDNIRRQRLGKNDFE